MEHLYIYTNDDMIHRATISADKNQDCEDLADQLYGNGDHGYTYTPAFGAVDGLVENSAAIQHTLRSK